MGSLLGHVSAGVSMLIWGLWWAFLSCLMYVKNVDLQKSGQRAQRVNPQKAASSVSKDRSWLPQPCKPQLPFEPIIKLVATGFGMFVDSSLQAQGGQVHFRPYSVDFNEDGQLVSHIVQFPHVLLYLGFFVSGLVDIASLFINLPRHTSQVFHSLAFVCEGVQFFFHIQGRDHMGSYTHQPVVYLAWMCAVLAVLRAISENKAINIGLAMCILLQGTWFIQLGFLLYPLDRMKWILPCPGVPASIKWRVQTKNDLQKYLTTQMKDCTSEEIAHCVAVGRDDNAALLVSFCLAMHILAVAVFILLLVYVMQSVVVKRQLYGRCLQRQTSRCRGKSMASYNLVKSEGSADEAELGCCKTSIHISEQDCAQGYSTRRKQCMEGKTVANAAY